MIKRIIDKRIKEKFMMDDVYLNGQARICGWQATLVYISLCRHSSINQESFPSIKLMCEELSISRNTVLKGIENLEKYNVIQVKKTRSKGGQWLNNTYILIDKSYWIRSQVPVKDTASQVPVEVLPSPCGGHDQVPVEDTKETHKQGNTYKETHTTEQSSGTSNLIDLFKEINPSYKNLFKRKTQHDSAKRLLEREGYEKISKIIKFIEKRRFDKFCPQISSPYQLEEKWSALEKYALGLKGEINKFKVAF